MEAVAGVETLRQRNPAWARGAEHEPVPHLMQRLASGLNSFDLGLLRNAVPNPATPYPIFNVRRGQQRGRRRHDHVGLQGREEHLVQLDGVRHHQQHHVGFLEAMAREEVGEPARCRAE